MLTGLVYALFAGLFGALASSSAKLSLGATYLKELCDTAVRTWSQEDDGTPGVDSTACEWVKHLGSSIAYTDQAEDHDHLSDMGLVHLFSAPDPSSITVCSETFPASTKRSPNVHIPLRLVCGLLLFSSNAVMWTFFAKALRHSSSSAQATVTTTASNFISSAFLGYGIFGESHALLWWVGISLILLGLFILHGSSLKDQQLDVKKDD